MTAKEKKFATTREWLIYRIDEFLENNPHITAECFGWRAIQDTKLVGRLRAGSDVTTRKLDRIIAYMGNPNQHKGGPNGRE